MKMIFKMENDMPDERSVLTEYLRSKGRKHSRQREEILEVLLGSGRHLTAAELYRRVHERDPSIGFVTVYRTMKLLCDCGICRELKLEDGIARYEKQIGHEHHDHLVCTRCGKVVEVVDETIERHQQRLFKKHGFYPQRHRMELYGVCRNCKKSG